MLGTNDGKYNALYDDSGQTPITSIAQHASYMQQIVAYCTGQGLQVILNKSPWAPPNAQNGQWVYNMPDYITEYWAQDMKLMDGVNVFIGDSGFYEATSQNPSLLGDQIHPTTAGYTLLGEYQGIALLNKIGFVNGPVCTFAFT